MKLDTPSSPQPAPAAGRVVCYGYAVWYATVTLLAFGLLQTIGQRPTQLVFDAAHYWETANTFVLNQPSTWYNSLRTYGYPLYLKLVRSVAEACGLEAQTLRLLALVEFGLHTFCAALAALAFARLGRHSLSLAQRNFGAALCFTLVQLNFALLGSTQDALPYHLTAVLVAWFYWSFTAPGRVKYAWRGLALALAIVVRPFNFNWACAVLALVIFFGLLNYLHRRDALGQVARHALKSFGWRNASLFALPFALVLGLQIFVIYRAEKRVDFVGQFARQMVGLHESLRGHVLRYDTYAGTDPSISPSVYYWSVRNQQLLAECAAQGVSQLGCAFQGPRHLLYATQTVLLKTVGMFQNFEWSTYRRDLSNTPNAIFWQGALLFFLFVYVSVEYARRLWLRAAIPLGEHVLVLGCGAYVLLYALFTAPQTDYITPVHQPLVVQGLVFLANRWPNKNKFWLPASIAVLSAGLYFYSYRKLLALMLIATKTG